MISSPGGYSTLQYDNATGGDGTASLTDGRGRATFSGLFVNETGTGFVCRFVAFNYAGTGVAWTDSDPFDVEVGEPYAIALSTPVGRMEGGSTFDTPPIIAMQVNKWRIPAVGRTPRLHACCYIERSTLFWLATVYPHELIQNKPSIRSIEGTAAAVQ